VITRRSFLAAPATALAAPFLNRNRFRLMANEERLYSGRAIDLVKRSTVLDMLGLLTLDYRRMTAWQIRPETFQFSDFERLKESGITVFHPAVGFTEGNVYSDSLADLSGWNKFLSAHPDKFQRIDSPADLENCKPSGRIGIVLGLQNSSHFRTVDDVDRFYALGQRISQLTYFHNRLGGGSTDALGLTAYGGEIVARMNRIGMAVDVSHCSDRTTLDAIAASRKPVLATHSNCRALVRGSARCKTDEAIRKLAARGGVLGVTLVRFFVCPGSPVTVENVLDHIDHIASIAGIEHAGLGTDVDLNGRDLCGSKHSDLDGMQYARKVFDVTEGLIRRKYSDAQIELVLGGNFKRALSEIWNMPATSGTRSPSNQTG
jgi:membrane dipeptidase